MSSTNNSNNEPAAAASMEPADPTTDRPELTLDQEIERVAEHSPKLGDLLRKVAKWHA